MGRVAELVCCNPLGGELVAEDGPSCFRGSNFELHDMLP